MMKYTFILIAAFAFMFTACLEANCAEDQQKQETTANNEEANAEEEFITAVGDSTVITVITMIMAARVIVRQINSKNKHRLKHERKNRLKAKGKSFQVRTVKIAQAHQESLIKAKLHKQVRIVSERIRRIKVPMQSHHRARKAQALETVAVIPHAEHAAVSNS